MSLALLQAEDLADETDRTASLSGYVFLDDNDNGLMDTSDWAISDVTISLTKEGSGDPIAIVYTKSDGSYTFDDPPPGTYSIKMLTTTSGLGKKLLGKLFDQNGDPVSDAGQVTKDGFSDIVLGDGYKGVNYIFAESVYPLAAVSKRLLIEGGPKHTVPEPATLVLLAIAGLVLGGYAWRRV